MNIKVGDYVRTKSGFIGKVIGRHGGYGLHYELDVNKEIQENLMNGIVREDNITKHSFNLVDLIEVGDILEIELSEEFVERNDKKVLTQLGDVYTKETLQKDIDNGIIQEIKKVLTHQQFEQNCYKTTTKQQT